MYTCSVLFIILSLVIVTEPRRCIGNKISRLENTDYKLPSDEVNNTTELYITYCLYGMMRKVVVENPIEECQCESYQKNCCYVKNSRCYKKKHAIMQGMQKEGLGYVFDVCTDTKAECCRKEGCRDDQLCRRRIRGTQLIPLEENRRMRKNRYIQHRRTKRTLSTLFEDEYDISYF